MSDDKHQHWFAYVSPDKVMCSCGLCAFAVVPELLGRNIHPVTTCDLPESKPTCDCGALKAKTTHADWCSVKGT